MLKPKVFLTENVSGLIKANAKWYLKEFVKRFDKDYKVQVFSLNVASMGVPQMRQRVFIIGLRKGYKLPNLRLDFNERQISFEEATKEFWHIFENDISKYALGKLWDEIDFLNGEVGHHKRFNLKRPDLNKPCNTLVEHMSNISAASICHPTIKRKLNKFEACVLQSYPLDYNFLNENPLSCIGRSVPPVMTAQISHQIYLQWLSKI
jgi:DNA (cytosine-5)-methyltransferase 1